MTDERTCTACGFPVGDMGFDTLYSGMCPDCLHEAYLNMGLVVQTQDARIKQLQGQIDFLQDECGV